MFTKNKKTLKTRRVDRADKIVMLFFMSLGIVLYFLI